MENFYRQSESIDLEALRLFNNKTNYYDELNPNPEFSRIDVSGIKDGKKCNIELKLRNISLDTYDTILIEPGKVKALLDAEGESFYVNFFEDEKKVVIWNIKSIDWSKVQIRKDIKIWDKGARKYKVEDRYLLPLDLAEVYIYDEELDEYILQEKNENK